MPNFTADSLRAMSTGRSACYVLFDQDGQLVFQGRLTLDEVDEKVAKLLRKKRSRR